MIRNINAASSFLTTLFIVISVLLSNNGFAGEYRIDTSSRSEFGLRLSRPNDPDICMAYRRAVIDYQAEVLPMRCVRPLDPSMTAFSRPAWRTLGEAEVVKVAKALSLYKLRTRLKHETDPDKRESLLQWKINLYMKGFHDGYLTYQVAEFDADNIAGNERVLRITNSSRDCSSVEPELRHMGNTWLYVIPEHGEGAEAIQIISPPNAKQAFFFNGRTYFDAWHEERSPAGIYRAIIVMEARRPGGRGIYGATVCRFQYVDQI